MLRKSLAVCSNVSVVVGCGATITLKTANHALSTAQRQRTSRADAPPSAKTAWIRRNETSTSNNEPGNVEGAPMNIKALAGLRRRDDGSNGEKGTAIIEFAFLLPVLLLVLLGAVQFGIVLANYVMLTNATSVGAMQFAISRSDTSPASDAWTAITNAAPSLTPTSNLEMTLSVGSPLTACVTNANSLSSAAAADTTCATALTNAAPSTGGTLLPASVTLTYPCGTQLTWYNFWSSSCKLTSTIAEGVQ